jgi:selenocysteine lyase/cysteine desulfurase
MMSRLEPFVGNAEAFPILHHWEFFNHAGVAPIPAVGAEALRRYAQQAETTAYLDSGWYQDLEILRRSAAAMLNAHRDEIAFIKNTGEGLSIVARGIDWNPGDRIVTTSVEYPTNIYPWMDVARQYGAELVMVPEESDEQSRRWVPTQRILDAASDPRCRMITLSHVEYASGQRHDLATIGRFCHEQGKLFCVDAIQSMGVLPIDVQAMHIDYLSADGHKWLLGPEGAGVFYCRRERLGTTRPLSIGWMNVVDNQNFGQYNDTLRPDAGRFECGSHNTPGLLALKASLELLASFGVEAVGQRLHQLNDRLIDGLTSKGYEIISPRSQERWSGIVSFVSPAHDHQQIVQRLKREHRTEIVLREGRLRVSPHFYNTEAQIDRLVERLPGH